MQSKTHSLIESCTNIAIGWSINLVAQLFIYPIYNMHPSLSDNIQIGCIFTVISLLRTYCIRRWFNKKAITHQIVTVNKWVDEHAEEFK